MNRPELKSIEELNKELTALNKVYSNAVDLNEAEIEEYIYSLNEVEKEKQLTEYILHLEKSIKTLSESLAEEMTQCKDLESEIEEMNKLLKKRVKLSYKDYFNKINIGGN